MRRIFTASAQTETNTFSPLRTGLTELRAFYVAPGTHPDAPTLYTAPLTIGRRVCGARNWALIEGPCYGAHPGGLIRRDAWETVRDDILAYAAAAGPLDAVALGLHGAMAADGYPDCEGDLLTRLRTIVGPACLIGATLDPHAHLSRAMTDAADVLIAFKEYPHTDGVARAEDLWRILQDALDGAVRPHMHVADCGMMDMFFTPIEPAATLVREMTALESEPGILSVSLIHGFPWGDVADFATRTLVVTDGANPHGAAVAQALAERVFAMRGKARTPLISVAEAVAMAHAHSASTPLVLADFADNAGAGAPSDSTYLIGGLIDAGVANAGAAFIFDPVAVQIATAAGVGARLPLRIGGKTCAFSGPPLDLDVAVVALAEDGEHDVKIVRAALGDVAVVRGPGDFDLVLTSKRSQCFAPNAFSVFGVDPRKKRVLVVKSMQHFYTGFSRISRDIAYVGTPGVASLDLNALPFTQVRRDLWPFTG
jgi:microcystin degradation protein MlrC